MSNAADAWTLKLSDIVIVIATILGPILAVQAQKFIERVTERKRQKLQIFHTLMATRATTMAPEHVKALNMIELEFGPSGSLMKQPRSDKAVIDALRQYFDHLGENFGQDEGAVRAWNLKTADLFVELMFQMSKNLGYKFDKVQLRRGIYHPKGHVDIEVKQGIIQDNVLRIVTGQQPLPMKVVEFPFSAEASTLQEEVSRGILDVLSGKRQLHVTTNEGHLKSAKDQERTSSVSATESGL